MEDNGNVNEQYDIGNSASSWDGFRARYAAADTEIALEVSTTGKYVARKLRDMGFHTHMADPSTLALIFRTARFQEKEDMKDTIEDVSRSEDKRTEKRC